MQKVMSKLVGDNRHRQIYKVHHLRRRRQVTDRACGGKLFTCEIARSVKPENALVLSWGASAWYKFDGSCTCSEDRLLGNDCHCGLWHALFGGSACALRWNLISPVLANYLMPSRLTLVADAANDLDQEQVGERLRGAVHPADSELR